MIAWRPSQTAGLGIAWLASILVVSRPSPAAEPLSVRLEYRPPAQSSASCPDEARFRAAVVQRLGRDPFVSETPRTIVVQLTRGTSSWAALVRVTEAGTVLGERSIDAAAGCEELAEGAALAVSMAIDPLLGLGSPATRSEVEARPKPATASKTPPPRRPPDVASAAPPEPDHGEQPLGSWVARAGARAWLGAVPGPSAGPSLGLGHRRPAWSLWLDAFGVLPRTREVANTDRAVSASLWGAQLAPCFESRWLRGCLLARSGVLLASGRGVDVPQSGVSWLGSLGTGFGHSFDWDRISLTPSIEGDFRFQRTVLSLDGEPVWTTPRVTGCFALELGYRL